MVEPELRVSAGQRLGAPETMAISTLDPGHKPPVMPPGRQITIRVRMLDETEELFEISQRASGKVLFDMVCTHLNLVEGDYFGLEYQDHRKMMVWLDHLKPIAKQIKRPKHTVLRFVVKFFPPDHAQLLEELTRYLFALQIKYDLASGRLTCNDSSAALLVSHIIQSEIGDFEETQSRQHLLNNSYIPDQMALIDSIMEFHHKHVGHTPAESDFQLLEVARRLEMYGIRLHPAKDREGTKLSLSVAHTGVLVFQGHTKINAFNWSKVRKLSFKRKRFLIKLRPDLNESAYQDTLEFLMASRDCCKVFWKICVEYHAFFRLFEEPKPKPKPVLFSRGSSFRFSGRTQKQLIDYVKDTEFKKIPFERKHSKVQYNSNLSPLPSLRSEVPKESASYTARERSHSPAKHHWKEPVLVSAEDSPALRTRGSPAGQPNGHEERAEEGARAAPAGGRHLAAEALNTEPVSSSPRLLGAARGMVNGQHQTNGDGHSPDGRQPSPLTSPLLNDAATRTDDEDEARRKRFPTDKAYFIAKELLTTERTYLKDLEVITVSFQSMLEKEEATPDSLKNVILSNFDPLYKFHTGFLREVEQRLALWEGRSNAHIKGDYQRIGDVMLKNIQGLKQMTAHLQKQAEMLRELEQACRASRKLEGLCRDFELQKVCYVPLSVFLLRPLHRLLHYKQILERLCKHYPPTHADFRDCRAALADVAEIASQLHSSMIKTENYQKLLELKKDLIGTDNLAAAGREFIRLGCLSKLSGKGLQQRMFFLFNDVLLYTSRGMTATNQFKVHGQLPLHGMTIRESEDEWGVPHSFTLVGQRQSVVVAASSLSEMEKWMEDIKAAVDLAKTSNGPTSELLASSVNDHKSLEDSSLEQESEDDLSASRTSLERQAPHRGNTMVHVCWHRTTSVSMVDYSMAVENQLSGNLLRKFKNSNGWQKLWVVFTNFSLFFYKTHQDDYPLASLPLLGYSVTIPSESENIHKDYVFKLHFKSHVYFFRSESEYSFERWMEVIRSATVSSGRGAVSTQKEAQAH
ncbi:FERM, ARHGEF and pleckstrin domain-containing protein 1 isoform X1 [Alosa sapidissima]|uniref:FERM, ARHGEF and pleckstrin domain-containing protein 1 isoform X1 n=1 Tax=Alosa sapidissima TaxID=34773 RepID=UPI001C0871D1|nr:FERM, ARHGEF and pleckstrin domain-containing protein 1 isoform X1 [Alosa sapidissima]XP_041933756.1 FERM, ARHGEF and pleckstrin domain-containing protein 1 isoform X1 [Alosa sapidissima]